MADEIHYQEAKNRLQSGTQILVKDGTYRNEDFGSGGNDNKAVFNIGKGFSDILLTNFPGHRRASNGVLGLSPNTRKFCFIHLI